MNRIALVVGVSCSGKGFLIDRVKPFLPKETLVVSFGERLFKELRGIHPKLRSRDQIRDLKYQEIEESVKAVNCWLVRNQPVVVDAHLVLKTEGRFVTVPETTRQLAPALYIHISAPVDEILARRRAKNRGRQELWETKEQIARHQDFSIWTTCREAQKAGVPFVQIWNKSEQLEKNICTLRQLLVVI